MLFVRERLHVDFGDRPLLILFMFSIILSALLGSRSLRGRQSDHDVRESTNPEQSSVMSDGKAMVFLVTKGWIFDQAGNAAGMFGISRDITKDRKSVV